MRFNKLILVGITMILGGLENIFRTIPYRTGAKNACSLGDNCLYQGSLVIIIGIIILIVQYRIQKKVEVSGDNDNSSP